MRLKHPQLEANNVTEAYGKEFADLLKELKKREIERIDGSFTISQGRGCIILDLNLKTKKQGS